MKPSLPTEHWSGDLTPLPESLKNRVILVAGASGGLGRTTALAAANSGAKVILLGRKVPDLEMLYDEIEVAGCAPPAIYPLDLEGATPRDYDDLSETIAREYGRLDGIVHAAAHLAGLMPAVEIKPEEWMRTLHVNLTAPFLLTQACQPLLTRAADASVVFVLDDPEFMGCAFWGAYGVAKYALQGLVSVLHEEWESGPVRVHALLPAPMRTALRRKVYFGEHTSLLPTAEASALAAVYLLSAKASSLQGKILDLRELRRSAA